MTTPPPTLTPRQQLADDIGVDERELADEQTPPPTPARTAPGIQDCAACPTE